ncbi:NADH-quinone oxidoreductase subunit C, partial [uncultured Marinobacter sp.]
MKTDATDIESLLGDFREDVLHVQPTLTGMPVFWVSRESIVDVLAHLKQQRAPFSMLYDLSAVDERLRGHRNGLPEADFTVFYHLLSVERN